MQVDLGRTLKGDFFQRGPLTSRREEILWETSRRRTDFDDVNDDAEKLRTLRIKPSLDADRDQIRQRVGEVRQVNSFFKMRRSQHYRPAEKGRNID